MGIRQFFQAGIDRVQFHFDIFPGLPYQPLPWLGYSKANRGIGCYDRLDTIKKVLSSHPISSALDIGCNVGFFSFSLAEQGIPVVGVEMDRKFFRTACYAKKRIGLKNIGFLNLEIDNDTAVLLPKTDLILLLSVWHHWVKYHGLDSATKLLNTIWKKSNRMMFFETGENEMPQDFHLPEMLPNPKEWLTNYLAETCKESEVRHLGTFKAFAPGGNEVKSTIERNLFQITRN